MQMRWVWICLCLLIAGIAGALMYNDIKYLMSLPQGSSIREWRFRLGAEFAVGFTAIYVAVKFLRPNPADPDLHR